MGIKRQAKALQFHTIRANNDTTPIVSVLAAFAMVFGISGIGFLGLSLVWLVAEGIAVSVVVRYSDKLPIGFKHQTSLAMTGTIRAYSADI